MLVKLLNYVEIISGGTPKTNVSAYWNGNIPWIAIDDFKETNKYIYETKKSITYDGLKNSNTNILRNKDIIISARGTVGKLALIHHDMAFNQSCFGIHIKDKLKLDPEYLFYYLKSNLIFILKKSQGAIFDSINLDSFKYIEIDLPPIIEQIKCTEILSSIDFQIERNNAMVKRLQVLGKTIYSKNLDFSNKEKLASKAIITTGKEDANHASINGKYKFFTCSDDVLSCDDFKFEGKSVLVAGNGNFNVKYYEGKFNAYQRTYVIRNDSIIGNLYYTLLFNTEVFRKKSNGSIIKFITIEMLNNIDIPQFSKETNHLLNKILFKINIVDDNTYRLKQLKNKLLPLLINGQLQ